MTGGGVSMIERGHRGGRLPFDTMQKLAYGLDYTIDELVDHAQRRPRRKVAKTA